MFSITREITEIHGNDVTIEVDLRDLCSHICKSPHDAYFLSFANVINGLQCEIRMHEVVLRWVCFVYNQNKCKKNQYVFSNILQSEFAAPQGYNVDCSKTRKRCENTSRNSIFTATLQPRHRTPSGPNNNIHVRRNIRAM